MRIPSIPPQRTAELSGLIDRIQAGDESAKGELFETLKGGLSFLIARQLGPQDAEDTVHDVFLIVLRAIYDRKLRDPERLLAYTRSVTRRRIASHIRENVKRRSRESGVDPDFLPAGRSPEEAASRREQVEIMKRLLEELKPKFREVLTRYYVFGETEEHVSREMDLTPTQFRLLKWRAKARFEELVKKRHGERRQPSNTG